MQPHHTCMQAHTQNINKNNMQGRVGSMDHGGTAVQMLWVCMCSCGKNKQEKNPQYFCQTDKQQ